MLSQDGKRCISASADGVIKVWDLAAGRVLYEMDEPSQGERDLVVAQDGNFLITASGDGWLRMRRLHDLSLVGALALDEILLGLASYDRSLLVGDRAGNIYYLSYVPGNT